MKRRRTLGLIAAAAALAAVAITAAASAAGPGKLTIAVYGDSPYLDKSTPALAALPHAEFNATPAFIDTINADQSVQEVVHVGDIHSGSEPCTRAYDLSVFGLWSVFRQPLIYTPGDNEWSDCTKKNEEPGSDNDNVATHPDLPLENLALVRQIFFAHPGWTLGQSPMHVVSQAQAYDRKHPTDAQYVENVRWQQGKTVFVTLNIPGGSNNDIDPWYASTHSTPWNPDQQAEMDQRTAADIRWLNAAFKHAKGAENVVIVGQSDMWDTSDSASHQTNYEPIIAAIAADTLEFGKPVLYLNGDSHVFRSDNPLQDNSTCFTEGASCSGDAYDQHPYYDVPNFHRIVVHGSTFPLEWLKLTVDQRPTDDLTATATSWGPFSWIRETQSQLTPTP
jgi:Calcineurin-like phosphoesterase